MNITLRPMSQLDMKRFALSVLMSASFGGMLQAQQPPAAVPGIPDPATNPSAPADSAPSEEVADFPPQKFEVRRYDAIAKKNPFMKETQIQGVQETVDWAKDLQLRAVTKLDGKYVVHVENAALKNEKEIEKRRLRFRRIIEGSALDGMTIKEVKPNRDPKLVEVILVNSDGKTANLKFDQNLIKSKALPPAQVNNMNPISPIMPPGGTVINMGGGNPPPTTGGGMPNIPPQVAQPPVPNRRGGAGGGNFNAQGNGRPNQGNNPNNNNTARRRVILPPGLNQ